VNKSREEAFFLTTGGHESKSESDLAVEKRLDKMQVRQDFLAGCVLLYGVALFIIFIEFLKGM